MYYIYYTYIWVYDIYVVGIPRIHDMFIPRVWTVDGRMATGYHTCAAVLAGRDCPFALYSWTVFPSDGEKKPSFDTVATI